MIRTGIAGPGEGRVNDLVIIIHLVQGGTEVKVEVQGIRSPPELILGHPRNKERKV
jgi:predicted RNA-binding protein with TRAM domain